MSDPAAADDRTGPALDPREVATALDVLRRGELEIEGRLLDASNATLYCALECDGVVATCVYKPVRGERPLWDFPDGTLAGREVAAYEVSAATGWAIVPPDGAARRPLRPGHVPAVDRRRRDRSTWPRWPAPPSRRCAGWRCSTR